MRTDQTKLGQFDRTIRNCEVVDIPAGALPKYISVKLPGVDEATVAAWWDGSPALAEGDFVKLARNNGSPQYEVTGASGGTAAQPAAHTHAASDITSGTMATARLGSGSASASTFLRGDSTWGTIGITVKNTSGATANAGDCGYIDAMGEYKTTTTANYTGSWCVVLTGAANGSDITVARSGRATINYTGTAPAAGDFLVTSTSAGLAQRSTIMRPEIFARCLAAGSGGTVSALLLCNTAPVFYLSSNVIYRCNSHSASIFVATLNGAPSATSFVYNTPSSGNADVLVPSASTELAKLMIYNSTRGTYRLVTACNTGTKTVTNVSVTDSWASGDTITVANATVGDALTERVVGFDLSQQTEIPLLARSVVLNTLASDTGAAGQVRQFHPYEAYSAAKLINDSNTQGTAQIYSNTPVPLIDQKFGKRELASGTGTKLTILKIVKYEVAAP